MREGEREREGEGERRRECESEGAEMFFESDGVGGREEGRDKRAIDTSRGQRWWGDGEYSPSPAVEEAREEKEIQAIAGVVMHARTCRRRGGGMK